MSDAPQSLISSIAPYFGWCVAVRFSIAFADCRRRRTLQTAPIIKSNPASPPYLVVSESVAILAATEDKAQQKPMLHKLLNEGELIMKWNRKIKNKGNAS